MSASAELQTCHDLAGLPCRASRRAGGKGDAAKVSGKHQLPIKTTWKYELPSHCSQGTAYIVSPQIPPSRK